MGKIQAKGITDCDNLARVNNCAKIIFNQEKTYNAVKDIFTFCDFEFTAIDEEKILFVDKGFANDENLGTLIEM